MAVNIKNILLIWTLTDIILFGQYVVASQEYNCSEVKCPSLSDIECPSDSYIRDLYEYHHHDKSIFLNENNNSINNNNVNDVDNNINIDNHVLNDEIFSNCCLIKKCACKVCHRPSCHNMSLVLMETVRETDIPGKCCGKYDCIYEPNCTEIQNTNGYGWLIDCQRCECLSGQRICHRSCDEIRLPPANCIGENSKIFSNGQTWKENECTHCECTNGEKKCQTSFCKPLNCINKIKLPGECCAICAPDITTTTTTTATAATSTASSSATSPSSTVLSPVLPCIQQTTTTTAGDTSETYSIHTEYVEVIQKSKENCILYGIIAALSITLIIFITLYCYEKSKQRSYRPVTSFDDNYNKIKIKNGEF